MQRLEVSGAVRPLYGSLGVRGLRMSPTLPLMALRAFAEHTALSGITFNPYPVNVENMVNP